MVVVVVVGGVGGESAACLRDLLSAGDLAADDLVLFVQLPGRQNQV